MADVDLADEEVTAILTEVAGDAGASSDVVGDAILAEEADDAGSSGTAGDAGGSEEADDALAAVAVGADGPQDTAAHS